MGETQMKLFACVLLLTGIAAAQQPLTLASQGSFFVGGEYKTMPASGTRAGPGEITINQMYVQYQIPLKGAQHVPVVMVHGCCLSSKTWETTPDGRMGWNEYFVRKDRSVYLADQSSRARSGFDPSTINAVKAGTVPPSQLPNMLGGHASGGLVDFSLRPEVRQSLSRTSNSRSRRWTSSTSR